MQIEIRGDKVIIDGYVNAVGRDSRPIRCQTGDFVEQVEPGAFRKALLRAKKIDLLLNHRPDRKLGSTEDGVLTLTEDNIGLRAHAEIGDEEAIEKARNKLLRGWSFGMYVNKDNMEQRSNAIPRRHLEDIDIFEVSLIDNTMMPYYAGTSVECRAEGDALAETRAFDDTVEVNEVLPDDYYSEREKQLEQLRAASQWCDAEKRLQELRYNPYHDPTNGRFTSGSGGNGGYLFVGKGQKGKGQYVFDRDIDAEYEEWKKNKADEKSNSNSTDIYSQKYTTADDYKKALAEKYNGITSIDKVKTAKDVADFINYDTQSQYSGTTKLDDGINKGFQSNWRKDRVYADDVVVSDLGFRDGTTKLTLPKHSKNIYKPSMDKLNDNGISIGEWYDDQNFLVIKKRGSRTKKWLEGFENRAFDDEESG